MESHMVDGIAHLTHTGRIGSANAPAVGAELGQTIPEGGVSQVVVDASELDYISSAGLRVPLRLRRRLSSLETIEVNP